MNDEIEVYRGVGFDFFKFIWLISEIVEVEVMFFDLGSVFFISLLFIIFVFCVFGCFSWIVSFGREGRGLMYFWYYCWFIVWFIVGSSIV